MTTRLIIALMLAGALGLAACGKKGPLEPATQTPETAQPQAEQTDQTDQTETEQSEPGSTWSDAPGPTDTDQEIVKPKGTLF